MTEPQVYTLQDGIKGWVAAGPQYRAFVDGFDENYWLQFAEVKTAGKRTVDTSMNEDENAMDEDTGDSPTKRRILGMRGGISS
jgi:arsenical-resistance protein 2